MFKSLSELFEEFNKSDDEGEIFFAAVAKWEEERFPKVNILTPMRFRLTIYPVMEVTKDPVNFLFTTLEQMQTASDTAASLLLYLQDDIKVMLQYSNMFVKEELVKGEWEDIEDD